MNCEQAIEVLPWHLNGTLGEDEKTEIREHLAACERCRQALADTRLAWKIFDQHIPAGALVAHAAGEEPEGIALAVLEEHLATCPECAAELELVRISRGLGEDDAVALMAPRSERPRMAGQPLRPAGLRWRRAALAAGLAGVVALGGWYKSAEKAHSLADRLATATSLPRPAASPQAALPSPGSAAGDAQRVAEMQRQLDAANKTLSDLKTAESRSREQLAQIEKRGPVSGPQVNTWVDDVQASADVVRGGGGNVKEVPSGATATLLLNAQGEAAGERTAEISDATGKIVWHGGGLRVNAGHHDYSLTIPAGWLPPGDYTIRLYRQEGGTRVPAESYAIREK
jgi:anti-sigma factor RsiW